jgi:hypothetical protein
MDEIDNKAMNKELNPPIGKTDIAKGFYKEINLSEYFKYGGRIDNIDIGKTFTRYRDENEGKLIQRIEYSHFNGKGNCNIYNVFFKDGTARSYAESWIATLVLFCLSENYLTITP